MRRLDSLHALPAYNDRRSMRDKVAHARPLRLARVPPEVVSAALDEDVPTTPNSDLAPIHLALDGALETDSVIYRVGSVHGALKPGGKIVYPNVGSMWSDDLVRLDLARFEGGDVRVGRHVCW